MLRDSYEFRAITHKDDRGAVVEVVVKSTEVCLHNLAWDINAFLLASGFSQATIDKVLILNENDL